MKKSEIPGPPHLIIVIFRYGIKPQPYHLFGINDNAALLTLIAGLFLIYCRYFLKVIPLNTVHFKTFRAIPSLQFIDGNGQMAVPAAQPAFLRGQEDQMEMSA
jgi:hypothetical protein